jgi:hypothetical protein
MTSKDIDSTTEKLLLIGLPFMNEAWAKFPNDQEHMIKAFKNTRGYKEAKELLKQLLAKEVEEAEKQYLKSVLRSRAKTNPDMTMKEFYEGTYNQKHDYRGATSQPNKEGQENA